MTEHVLFIARHSMLVRGAVGMLEHAAPIRPMKLYDVSSVTESDDARQPFLRFVCPHPELACHVGLVQQSQSDPVVAARVRNRKPGETVVMCATRDHPPVVKDPTLRKWHPPVRRSREHQRTVPTIGPHAKMGVEANSIAIRRT